MLLTPYDVMRHFVFLWGCRNRGKSPHYDHQSAVEVTAVFRNTHGMLTPNSPAQATLSMWFVDADSPGMYRQVGPQPVPQLVKQLFSTGTVVGYHAQVAMSGRVPTGIAADGGALSMCSQGAPCHSIFLVLHGHLCFCICRHAAACDLGCHAQAS